MISRPGQGKYKTNLEHCVVPERKEVLKKDGGICPKDTRANLKELPVAQS